MKALDMFKKLGYELQEEKLYKKDTAYKRSSFGIIFSFDTKEILVCDWNDYVKDNEKGYIHSTDLEEHKAIHKQLEEMGWLND